MDQHAASQYDATDVEKVESIKVTERGNYYYVKWRNLEDRHMNSWVEEPFLLGSEALTRFLEKNASEASEEPLFVRQTKNTIILESQSENDDDDSDELDEIPKFQRARIRRQKRVISSSPETNVPATSLIAPLTSYSVEKESLLLKSDDSRKNKVSKISSNSDVHNSPTSGRESTRIKTPELNIEREGLERPDVNQSALPDIDRTTPPTTPKATPPSANTETIKIPILAKHSLPQTSTESQLTSSKYSLQQRDNEQNRSQNFAEISKKFDNLLDLISHNVQKDRTTKRIEGYATKHRRSQTSSDATTLPDRGIAKEVSISHALYNGNAPHLGRIRSSSEMKSPMKFSESQSASPSISLHKTPNSIVGSSAQTSTAKLKSCLKSTSLPPAPPPPPPPSTLWRGDIEWGDYKLLDLNLQAVRATAALDTIQSTMKDHPSIQIKSFLSQQFLIEYIRSPPTLLSLSFPADSVRYGKLRNFLTINNVAGLIPISLECSFAIVPYSFPLLAADIDSSNLSLKQALFMVHIELPSSSPNIGTNKDLDSRTVTDFSSSEAYDWHMVKHVYAVPKQVASMPKDKSIFIASGHPDASKVQHAAQGHGYNIVNDPTDPSIYAVLLHNEPFPHEQIPELLELKRPGVHFFLFGYSGCERYTRMDQEVFPEHSGGLVTIDTLDLVRQPEVLIQIIHDVEKLNALKHSDLQPRWQIVFRENIFRDFEKLGQTAEYKNRADLARWQVIKALEEDLVSIMEQRVESADTVSQWFDCVAKAFASTQRFFVQVVLDKPNYSSHRVNMVKPHELLNRFKQ